jgi:GNAT superfamily N-acetyltransferase
MDNIRYAKTSDLDEIQRIALICFGKLQTKKQDIIDWLELPASRMIVYTVPDVRTHPLAGYASYSISPSKKVILHNMAVRPKYQRLGIGSVILAYILQDCSRFNCPVPEENLPMQMLLKKLNIPCIKICKQKDETLYVFQSEARHLESSLFS